MKAEVTIVRLELGFRMNTQSFGDFLTRSLIRNCLTNSYSLMNFDLFLQLQRMVGYGYHYTRGCHSNLEFDILLA